MSRFSHSIRVILIAGIVLLGMMSADITMMYAKTYIQADAAVMTAVTGTVFWAALAGGYFCIILAVAAEKRRVRSIRSGSHVVQTEEDRRYFFSCTAAWVSDPAMIATAVLFILSITLQCFPEVCGFVFLSGLVFTVNMHFICNSRIYRKYFVNKKTNEQSYMRKIG